MENNCTIEIRVLSRERAIQDVIDDVRGAIGDFYHVDSVVSDVGEDGFKVGFPRYLEYQVESIARDLGEIVEGISVVAEKVPEKVAVETGVRVEEAHGLVDRQWEKEWVGFCSKLQTTGVTVNGSPLSWGEKKEGEE